MAKEVSRITDAELVSRLECLVREDRSLGAKWLVHLGELDARGVYRELGFSSMFAYCMSGLHMSEGEASLRICAARLVRRLPLVLGYFEANEVHLSAIKLLAPHLTEHNCVELLKRARGKSKRQVEDIVAQLAPKEDVPARMRKLPRARGSIASSTNVVSAPLALHLSADSSAAPANVAVPPCAAAQSDSRPVQEFALQPTRTRACTTPLSPGRFKLELTLGQEAHDELEQLRELLRHQNPSGDLTQIIERAIKELFERTMKKRFAQRSERTRSEVRVETHVIADNASEPQRCSQARSEPRVQDELCSNERTQEARVEGDRSGVGLRRDSKRNSRYIPRAVVRAVYARDGGQCTFVGSDGRRCAERGFLEIHHHETTHAHGGAPTLENLRLACRAHNALYAERDYGRQFMQNKQRMAAVEKSMFRNMSLFDQSSSSCHTASGL